MTSNESASPIPAAPSVMMKSPSNLDNNSHMTIRLIGKRLCVDGFLYINSHTDKNNIVHWECRRRRKGGCQAGVTTSNPLLNSKVILHQGLDKVTHNHSSSVQEIEEAEITARFEEAEKVELISKDICLLSESHSETELQMVTSSSEPQEEMDVDQCVSESKSKQPVQKTSGKVVYNVGLPEYTLSPTPPRIVGCRLCINGFMYTRTYSYGSCKLPKTYWQCRKYSTGECSSTAITSNPDFSQDLIVYKGPTESKHSHPAILSDIEEAKVAVRGRPRKSNFNKSNIITQTNSETVPAIAQSSNTHISKSLKSKEVGEGDDLIRAHADTSEEILARADSNANPVHHPKCVRLIGKRLYIDGYIYSKHSNSGSETAWLCKRYRKTGCNARAYTSNSSMGEEVTVHRVDDLSNHDHSPSELDVEEAELVAKLHLNRSKFESLQAAQSQNRSNGVNVENAPGIDYQQDLKTKSTEIVSSESKGPLPEAREDSSTLPSKISNSSESARVIGGRLCIDGYFYSMKQQHKTNINWHCRRYRLLNNRCPATATTSDYLKGEKLVVYKGLETSKHNHPPIPAEMQEAEGLAKFNTMEKSKLKTPVYAYKNRMPKNSQSKINRCHLSSSSRAKSLHPSQHSTRVTKTSACKTVPSTIHLEFSRLQNDETYREFLKAFLKKPTFDKESVIEALGVTYPSEQNRVIAYDRAYEIVLKNRDKIERDLGALKKDPDAPIDALNVPYSLTFQEEGFEIDIDGEQNTKNIDPDNRSSNDSTVSQDNIAAKSHLGQETNEMVLDTCTSKIDSLPKPTSKTQENLTLEQAMETDTISPIPVTVAERSGTNPRTLLNIANQDKVVTIPPVSDAVSKTNLPSSESPLSTVNQDKFETVPPIPSVAPETNISSSEVPLPPPLPADENEVKVKQEIVFIDLTDDSDDTKVKQECATGAETAMEQSQPEEAVSFKGNPVPLVQNFDSLRGMGAFGFPQQNLPQNNFGMPLNFIHPYYNQGTYNPFTNYSMECPNFNVPIMVNESQMQWFLNMRNNQAVEPEQPYAQIQNLEQPHY